MRSSVETTMEPQVIYLVESRPRRSIREIYAARSATWLGCLHILCGLVILTAAIVGLVHEAPPDATGVWTSVIFLTSGGLTIGGARSANKCLVVATLVMAVISAISAGILLIIVTMNAIVFESMSRYDCSYLHTCTGEEARKISYVLQVALALAMLLAATSSAILACRPLCCRPFLQTGLRRVVF